MRARQVLQRCLDSALSPMHALRRQTLLLAVASLLAGRRLVLIDLARSWLGAERLRTPPKRLDRLLSNPRLHAERERLYGGMVRWLVRSPTPVIAVDWCRLEGDGRWHVLRAAVPVGGRTLTRCSRNGNLHRRRQSIAFLNASTRCCPNTAIRS
ncbi:hypothetical protein [Xanthomonas translucens]|uniref:hypothetical protein n=1 Tax=Xanthomonas campestris pv. translucens TaxID=343 RepID=UPI000AADA725|nr:hypothetical protein [Xanthomonas translucens]MBC3973398.1 hypothetical protein [Xanthomonas translucens pv. undulosa]MCT8272660.1 hypothetical protein [Xanthomonas translucens pv. undulosa]MCT8283975.1 hypothetical protein [Xanthomonas translucens pv. undulosa]MCT8318783.1 hypothetical protein [Xanthomonas translucens pv. undulosa]QEN94425.1 hypothetical protein F0H33_14485 [Xanthomonas translucens pv. undulosa]